MKQNELTNTAYVEFETDDRTKWRSPRPAFDVRHFNRQLKHKTGTINDVPRFRLRWAGECDEYIIEEYDTILGYSYRDDKGIERIELTPEAVPTDKVAVPVYEYTKVRVPRWVIEEFRDGIYQKAWFIEEVEILQKEYGRVDLLSHYREPSERDLEMARHLAFLRQHLSDADIAAGLEMLRERDNKERQAVKAEIRDEMIHDAQKVLIDGSPNAAKFGFDPNLRVDIHAHSKALIKEHNKNL